MSRFLFAVPAIIVLLLHSPPASAAAPVRPNIIFVLSDDVGIDGISCYGADAHKTPHIDALAASGLRFQTCYASPLCGPSRCLLMTGRYAFRTGGLTNQSWRRGGPGAKSANEYPIARLMKDAGYVTGHAGKWRQLGESPGDWGFDEYLTDNTASGWYWETKYNKNGEIITLPENTYGPDLIQNFTIDFLRRHKDKPFFFYYAMHLVHTPTVRTPDSEPGTKNRNRLYDDNIRYMDKQVGQLVEELERLGLRQNTLILFSGDNGTAAGYPSPVGGRMINGWKQSMQEGGSRVPFIASWPAVTPKGKVSEDIVSFVDPYATFAELAGAKMPQGLKSDSISFAPQLRGEKGKPRAWAYVQLGAKWYVREPAYKLDQAGRLYDMSDAPFVERLVEPADDTEKSKAARQRLGAVLTELNPTAGREDIIVRATGPWKSGDKLESAAAPEIARKTLDITAEVEATGADGLIVSQGAGTRGYALYLADGKLVFGVRKNSKLTTIAAKEPLGSGHFTVEGTLGAGGAMALSVNGKQVADGTGPGLIGQQPGVGLSVGQSQEGAVGDYKPPFTFAGKITNVQVKTAAPK
jgi:arylsulfatase A